ncbi:MAG: asparagine synthase, partial [Pseudonocardiaceae bacterium]
MRIAIIGCCSITAAQLSTFLAGVEQIADVDRIVRVLSGSFHLIASVKGQVRVQGSVSALRQVFYARVPGLTVAADNAQVLVSLAGATIDDRLIAPRLAYPQLPYPLDGQCLWRGVRNLSSDCCLILDDEGGDHILQWWSAPEPVLSLTEGAVAVRRALTDAVQARTTGDGLISADL